MKLQWNRSLRISVCTAAMLGAGWVQAQTPAQPEHHAPAAQALEHQHTAGKGHPHEGKKAAKHDKPEHKASSGKKGHPHNHQHKPSAGKHAKPQQHEPAVEQKHHRGEGQTQHMNEFERNALQRCEIFKTNEDRKACVERVRQPKISGSVSGGGVLREYTQTYQVPAASDGQAVQHHSAPHRHKGHPPVQPMRNP